jgi:hypothetical protein
LREKRRLRVFENWVLKIIFGPKKNEVIYERRKVHNKEVTEQYSSPNIFLVIISKETTWKTQALMGR